jgi:hypothetical protein
MFTMDTQKVKEIEEKIADLKGRWPRHTVQPNMWRELEDLEAQLAAAKREDQSGIRPV